MTFWLIMGVVVAFAGALNWYLLKTREGTGMDPSRMRAYRRGAYGGATWTLVVIVRLVTHKYH